VLHGISIRICSISQVFVAQQQQPQPKCEQSENWQARQQWPIKDKDTRGHVGRPRLQKASVDLLERTCFAGGEGSCGQHSAEVGRCWLLLLLRPQAVG
jgi:hypothetical protein